MIRRRGLQRQMTNIRRVKQALKLQGFDFVIFEDMSLSERVELLNDCSILVGESGAGLAHGYFLDSGAKIVEIRHPSMCGSLEHSTLSSTFSGRYTVLQGDFSSLIMKLIYGSDAYRVNVSKLILTLEER